jgi:hypothetical protein
MILAAFAMERQQNASGARQQLDEARAAALEHGLTDLLPEIERLMARLDSRE